MFIDISPQRYRCASSDLPYRQSHCLGVFKIQLSEKAFELSIDYAILVWGYFDPISSILESAIYHFSETDQ